ncbi:MAG: hypothetical protein U9R21_01675 [Candidatus Thermoplasmatota archaeon]|nr:hypothetical protein [Candidatus Thermoplasmatota archaeon]
MEHYLIKKSFVLCIIILIIGTGIVPIINGNDRTINPITDQDNKNSIFFGNINIEKKEILSDSFYTNDEWYKTFGSNDADIAEYLIQSKSGGYILTGGTLFGAGFFDVWLIKTDYNGNEIWNKTYGGTEEDVGHCVIEAHDGGYIITGYTRSSGSGLDDVWLIRTDDHGNEIWNKTYGGIYDEWGKHVIRVHGGYVIAGAKASSHGNMDIWIIKIDEYGNELWNKTFGGKNSDYGNRILQLDDGGYVIVGNTISYGAGFFDIWLIKIDEYGNELWNKTFGGNDADRGEDIIQTSDGGYLITGGATPSDAGWDDVILIKTNENGDMQWTKSYGGSDQDIAYSVILTDDGGYLLGGTTASYGPGSFNAWLIKTDEWGDEIWNKTFGGIRGEESADRIIQLEDGSYVFVGDTYSYGAGAGDFWLVKCQDYLPPKMSIIKPQEGFLYVLDKDIIRIGITFILGEITVKLMVNDPDERIQNVELYLFGPNIDPKEPNAILYDHPYEWVLDGPVLGSRGLLAVAYYSNNSAHVSNIIYFWMFNI